MMTATTASANLASRCVHSSSSRHPHARGLMMKNTTNPKERQLENYLVQRGQFRLLGYRSSPLPNNVITRAQSEADTSTSSFSSASLSGKGEEGGGTTKSSKITKLTSPVSKAQFVNFFAWRYRTSPCTNRPPL